MNSDPQSPAPDAPGPQSSAPEAPGGPQSPGPQSPPPPPGGASAGPQAPAAMATAPMSGQPELCSVGKRFGAYVLDVVLSIVTLGIGYLIWLLIILGRGQTPAKQILKMRTVDVNTGRVPSYGMMFVREIPAKLVVGLVAWGTVIGLVLYFWPAWDGKNQELWDKMVSTVVVEDPNDALAPA